MSTVTHTPTHPPTHRQMVGEEKWFQLPSVSTSPRMTQHIISSIHAYTRPSPNTWRAGRVGEWSVGEWSHARLTHVLIVHTLTHRSRLWGNVTLSSCLDLCVLMAEWCLFSDGIEICGEFLVYVNITALEPILFGNAFVSRRILALTTYLIQSNFITFSSMLDRLYKNTLFQHKPLTLC